MKRLLILTLLAGIGLLAQDPTPVYNGPMIIRGGTTPLTVHKNTAFNGTHTQTGNAVITPLVAPGAPTVTPTPGGGGTTWGYKVVACLDALCVSHTTASVETDDVAGPADLLADGSAKETISWTGVKGALFYAVRRIAWGGTCRGAACAGGSIGITTLTNLEDTGQVGDGTATPLTNNTGNLAVGLISGNPVISDSLQVPRLGVGIAPHATHPLVVHAGTNTNLRVVDYLPGTIGVGYLNDAGTTFVDSVTQGLTQDFYTGAGAANLSALYLHSNRYAGFNTRARTGNTNPTQRADVWDGNIEVADSGTLGTESLKNGTDFAVTWVVVNDFAIAGAQAVYTDNVHDGHIYQTAANQNTPAVANRWYKFQYDVVNNSLTGTPLAWITAEYSLAIQYLDLTVGASKVVYFKSAVVPGIFRIDVSGTTGGVLTLDNFGLKEVQGGNVIVNGLITGGGTNGIRILSSGAVQLTGPALGTTYGGLGASFAAAGAGLYPKSNGATPAVFAASTLAASGVGACAANQWASTLNGDAAPTCTQPAASNLSNGVQGSGAVVLATSPTTTDQTLTRPILGYYAVGTLPAAASYTAAVAVVTDALTAGSCTVNGGTAISLCRSNGAAWVPLGDGGGGALTPWTSDVSAAYYTLTNLGQVLFVSSEGLPTAPTAGAPTAGGSCTDGDHSFSVSYATAHGQSRSGAASGTQTCGAGNNTIPISGIPTGTPVVTTGRNVCATKAGGSHYYQVGASPTIADNSTTTYSFITADASLTVLCPMEDTTTATLYRDGKLIGFVGPTNTALGFNALATPSDGGGNTAVGTNALRYDTTGYDNTALGKDALGSNATGSSNIAIGYLALSSSTGSSKNIAIGEGALSATGNSIDVVAVGHQALKSNTTGSYNTAVGFQAGYNSGVALETLGQCTFLGFQANSSANALSNCMALGNGAQVTKDNQTVLGNASVVETLLRGHVGTTQAAVPTLSACGTGTPAMEAGSTDHRGFFTTGGGVLTSCTMTFNIAYAVRPACAVYGDNAVAVVGLNWTTAVGTLVVQATSMTAQTFGYICQ